MTILWALPLIVLLWGMLKYPAVLVASKYLLDSYAGGFSGAKAFLLVLFFLTLALLSPLKSRWKASWGKWLALGMVALHGLALGEYIYYCHHYDLPVNQRSVFVHDGLQSSTRLEHFHTSKAALAALLPYSGQGFDAGVPYLAVYPQPLLVIHGLLFLAVCCLVVMMVHHYQKELSGPRSLVLALGIYPLIKGLVDGGPFSGADAGRLAFLAVIFLPRKQRNLALGVASCLLLANLIIEAPKGLFYNLFRVFAAVATLSLPLLWEKAKEQRAYYGAFAVGLIVLFGTPMLYHNLYAVRRQPPFSIATWQYGQSKLESGWPLFIVSKGSLPPSEVGELVEEIAGKRLVVSKVKLTRETTPFEVCRLYGLNVLRTPVLWYPYPGYVVMEGPFQMENPKSWLKSKAVLRYSFHSLEGWTTLVLEMVPGAQTNVACDVLPKGPYATRRVDMMFEEPELKSPWMTVP